MVCKFRIVADMEWLRTHAYKNKHIGFPTRSFSSNSLHRRHKNPFDSALEWNGQQCRSSCRTPRIRRFRIVALASLQWLWTHMHIRSEIGFPTIAISRIYPTPKTQEPLWFSTGMRWTTMQIIMLNSKSLSHGGCSTQEHRGGTLRLITCCRL